MEKEVSDIVAQSKIMKKLIISLIVLLFSIPTFAQNGKKVKGTINNYSENISARKISNEFNNGLRSFYTSQYEDAERIFSNIVRNFPQHAPSYYMLSKIYSLKKSYTESEEVLNHAIKIDKSNIWYKVALGETLLITENYKKAVSVWENICSEIPNNEIYLYNLYECYNKLNNYPKMIELMDKIEEKFGYREAITKNKVALWLSKNNIEAAIGEYDKIIKKHPLEVSNYIKVGLLCEEHKFFDKALFYYEKVYSLFPENADVNMMLANYWILRKDEEKGAKYIAFLIPNPNVDIAKKVPFMRKQIDNWSNQNNKKVELWAQDLYKAHPDNAQAYEILALVCMKQQNYAEASENFQKSLKIDDSNIENWKNFIISSEKSNNYGKIVGFEDEITTLFPQTPQMLIALASAFLKKNNPEKAIEYYKNALAFAFETDEISLINKGLYDAYMMKGDSESAKKYLK